MRILIADGHPVMRLGLKGLLLSTEARVVGESGCGEETLRLAEQTGPDLVVLGLDLVEEMDGIEACRRLKALPEPPRVLVHTARDLPEDVCSCLFAGADAFLHKSAGCGMLLDAMRRVVEGERVWLPGELAGEPRARLEASAKGAVLTHKEREVLAMMACGYHNKEMAQSLYLGLPTIKTHVRSVLRKFGARSREELFWGGRDSESSELFR